MKQSEIFCKTYKESPKDEASINAQLLIRAGFVYKEMAGVYSFLPLGFKVLKKIENIIREEMNAISGQEILMTVLQPQNLWEETDRWLKGVGESMYKCRQTSLNGGEKEIGLGPTHEEMITDIVRRSIKSYEDLPLYLYQIQTKFRKELRARSGLLRGREFGMKDLYSFHASEDDFKSYYQKAIKSYFKVFKRLGLRPILTEASGAGFTKDYTHEFQVLAEGGEDVIVYCKKGDFAQNKEIAVLKVGDYCPVCRSLLYEGKSIEVGNIFPLGKKYSEKMEALFTDKDGKRKPIVMGCYGIGTTRVMGTVVEVSHDDRGIVWPREIAPFFVHLLQIEKDKKVKKAAEKVCLDLEERGIEVLCDDREKTAGEKFADADLIGIPLRVVVSKRTLDKNSVEVKKRNEEKASLIKISLAGFHIEKNYAK